MLSNKEQDLDLNHAHRHSDMTVGLLVLRVAIVETADLEEVISSLGYQPKSGIRSDLDDDKVASDGRPPPETVDGGDPGQRRGQFQQRVRARHEVVFQLREFEGCLRLFSVLTTYE